MRQPIRGLTLALAVCAALPVHSQTRIPSTNPLQTLPQTQAPQPESSVTTRIQPQQNPQLAALLATPVTPARFDVQGVKSVDFAQIAEPFRALAGRTVTVGDLIAAAQKCTQHYRDAGYALSFCYIPTQDFAAGVVKVQAVEGYVSKVEIEGEPGKLGRRMRAIAERLQTDRPLRQATFERYSQILSFLPGARISVDVPPPQTVDGATTLRLGVNRRKYDAGIALDFNHPGTQGLITGSLNALTQQAEQWSIAALYPDGDDDARFYSAGYSQMVGSDGLVGRVDASSYRGRPDADGNLPWFLHRRVDQDRATLSARYPFLLRSRRALMGNASFYGTTQSDRFDNILNGAMIEQRTDTRVATIGLDYVEAQEKGSRQAGFAIARGIDAWGAKSRVRTNVDGPALLVADDVSFTRYNLTFAQSRVWKQRYTGVLRASGQYSPDRLPSSEQVSFGGSRYALAYDPGDATGDSGWGASAELSRGFNGKGRWLKAVAPYVMVQHARVYLDEGRALADQLGTVALGVRLSDNKHYTVDVALAQPTADLPPDAREREPRWNLTFSYQLL